MTELLENTVKELEKALVDQTLKANADLTKANEQIYELQCELGQKTAMVEGMVEKAISEIKEKLVTEFKIEKIALMDQVNSMEGMLRETKNKLSAAEEGRTSLIDQYHTLEGRLKVYENSTNPKIKKVLDRAAEDPDFYRRIIEAAEKIDLLDISPEQESELERLKKEKTQLANRVIELQNYLDDGTNFIEVLQKELKDLREQQTDDKLSSKFGLLSQHSPGSMFQSNPGLNPLDSMIDSPIKLPSPPKPVILTTWRKVLYIKEGTTSPSTNSNELMANLAALTKERGELANSLKSVSKYLDESKAANKEQLVLIAQKDSEMAKVKDELANKTIQLNNAINKLAELRKHLATVQSHVPEVVPVLAFIDSEKKDPSEGQRLTAEIRDISDKLKANKPTGQQPQGNAPVSNSQYNAEEIVGQNLALQTEIARLREEIQGMKAKQFGSDMNEDISPVHHDQEFSSPVSTRVFQGGENTSKNANLEVCTTKTFNLAGAMKSADDQTENSQLQKSLEDELQDLIVATSMNEGLSKIEMCLEVYKFDFKPEVKKVPAVVESVVPLPVQTGINRIDSFELGMPALPRFNDGTQQSYSPALNRVDSFQQDMPALPKFTAADNIKLTKEVDSFVVDNSKKLPAANEDTFFFNVKPTKIEELPAIPESRESKIKSETEIQSSVVLKNQRGSFSLILDTDNPSMPVESLLVNPSTSENADKRLAKKHSIGEDIQTQLMMLKKNEFYFKADKTPHSNFMDESNQVSPEKMFVKSNNPFDRSQGKEMFFNEGSQGKSQAAVQIQEMLPQQIPEKQRTSSNFDPLALAASMKNPYTDEPAEEFFGVSDKRDTFSMNIDQSKTKKDDDRRKSNVNLERFQTFQPGQKAFGENPYIDNLPNRVEGLSPDGRMNQDDSAPTKMRQLATLTAINMMKRPGKKQKAGISRLLSDPR